MQMSTSGWASTSQVNVSSAKAPVVFMCICCKVELRLELIWKHRPMSHQALLRFKWPGDNFRDKGSSKAINGVFTSSCKYHSDVLFTSEYESIYYTTYSTIYTPNYIRAVFSAGLRSWHFLFLTWGQWQHVTFTNFVPLFSRWILSWKNPPRAKEELRVTKQVWGHWNQSSGINESDKTARSLSWLLLGTPPWLKESITLGHGWFFRWVIWWQLVLWTLTWSSGVPQLP